MQAAQGKASAALAASATPVAKMHLTLLLLSLPDAAARAEATAAFRAAAPAAVQAALGGNSHRR